MTICIRISRYQTPQFDKDKSGQLDKAELDKAISQVLGLLGKKKSKVSPELSAMVMRSLDKDNSGTISREEFAAAVEIALKLIDDDKKKKKKKI